MKKILFILTVSLVYSQGALGSTKDSKEKTDNQKNVKSVAASSLSSNSSSNGASQVHGAGIPTLAASMSGSSSWNNASLRSAQATVAGKTIQETDAKIQIDAASLDGKFLSLIVNIPWANIAKCREIADSKKYEQEFIDKMKYIVKTRTSWLPFEKAFELAVVRFKHPTYGILWVHEIDLSLLKS